MCQANFMSDQKKSEPRERILEVADHLFYTEGVRATGTEKIMAVADVAKSTFYRHFASKDALVLAYLTKRDRALWDYLAYPTSPKDLREALIKFEQMTNWPEIIGCPFLRIASEFPDTAHPFHCRVIEHKDKLRDYLAQFLKPDLVDRDAAAREILGVIDGALSAKMVYGASRQISLLPAAEAILGSLQAACL